MSAPLRPDHQAGANCYLPQAEPEPLGHRNPAPVPCSFPKVPRWRQTSRFPAAAARGRIRSWPSTTSTRWARSPASCQPNAPLLSQRKSRGPILVTRARLRSSRKKGTSTTQPPKPVAFVAQRAARGPCDDKSLDAVNCPIPCGRAPPRVARRSLLQFQRLGAAPQRRGCNARR
jgi:hypothetical protein